MAFGEVIAKIGGKQRVLRFNLNARYEFCKMHNLTQEEVQDYFGDLHNVEAVRDMVYCALRAADLADGRPVDYNQYTVGEWISDMDQNDFNQMMIGSSDANREEPAQKKSEVNT